MKFCLICDVADSTPGASICVRCGAELVPVPPQTAPMPPGT